MANVVGLDAAGGELPDLGKGKRLAWRGIGWFFGGGSWAGVVWRLGREVGSSVHMVNGLSHGPEALK